MAKSETRIFIQRTPKEVFDFLSAPENHHQWQGNTEFAEWSSEGSLGVGSSFNIGVRNFGRLIESEVEIIAWDPPTELGTKADQGPMVLASTTKVTPQGDGAFVSYTSQLQMKGVLKLAEGLMSRLFKSQFQENLNRLKAVLESDPTF